MNTPDPVPPCPHCGGPRTLQRMHVLATGEKFESRYCAQCPRVELAVTYVPPARIWIDHPYLIDQESGEPSVPQFFKNEDRLSFDERFADPSNYFDEEAGVYKSMHDAGDQE